MVLQFIIICEFQGRAKKLMLDQGLAGDGAEGSKEKNPVFIAEKKFFELLKAQKDARMKQNKPLVFNDDE